MEAITIIPTNAQQGNVLIALLKEMNVHFTTYSDTEEIEVSEAAMQSIQQGLEDAKNGRLINELEANKIFQNVINQVD